MKYHPYYLYTALGLLGLYIIIALFATPFFMRLSMSNALANDLEAAQQEATIIATMSEGISSKADAEKFKDLKERIQKSIKGTNTNTIFNSVFDWSGKYICHPENTRIANKVPQSNAIAVGNEGELTGSLLYDMIFKQTDSISSEGIIKLTEVSESDWIIASHINKEKILSQASGIRTQVYIIFLVIGLLTLVFFLGTLRIVSSYYEKQLALKNTKLEDGVLNLSKLNASLENYQKNLSDFKREQEEAQKLAEEQLETTVTTEETKITKTTTKQRILTYVRNELLPIATEDISYIYVENTITYIVRKDGKRSTSSESLDLIYSYLDEKSFFRANRQIIVAISAIETITKFGNSKLKIQVNPTSEIDIIIGKNKAASFKQWLDL